jgi:putative sterol carrier protein
MSRRPGEGKLVTEPIEGFFDDLALRGHEPLLRRAKGSLRIDLEDGADTERWLVTIDEGDVSVSHRNAKADCVIRTSKEVFARMVSGRMNAMSAILRGVLGIEGDPGILVLFQRIFPGPPKAKSKPKRATRAGSQRT